MLKQVLALGALCAATNALAQGGEGHEALRRPERQTIGINDQFLGQLSPDEKTLFFVSSQETRKEIYAQDVEEGRARIVFDEGADVTWPRVSPNGKQLLYISFSDQATGQLCIRDLPAAKKRRCLEDTSAALQAEWIDDQHIALVARTSIGGDLQLAEVTVQRKLKSRALYEKNWSNPALTPDGRWLVYVPLDRVDTHVGPGFAARTARRLEAVRIDGAQRGHATPVKLALDLPGMTGQPAFARDGSALYFTQFFSDSNHDGFIDASDHGVLFRVPFQSGTDDAPARAAALAPVQLTDSWNNCQYPAPAQHRLLTTCSHGAELAIYELPLDGEIPGDWDAERLKLELGLGARREEQLLLYRHALARATNLSWQRLIMMRLVMAHLEMEEFDAAEFYAHKVEALRDPATRGIWRPLVTLAAHRRARSEQERGRMVESFAEEAQKRLDELAPRDKDSAAARVLQHVVRSEIEDALGDKLRARSELEAAQVDDETPRAVVEAYFSRADALYRELDDRDALVAVAQRLSTLPKLTPDHQLEFARASVRALVRGLATDEAEAVLARALRSAPADSELAFALQLMQATLAVREQRPAPEVKERLLAIYDAQTRPDRRRAVVLDALQHATEVCADGILEGISERYVDDVAKGTEERRRAERLYRRAILGRAFRRWEHGKLAEARADFDDVFRRTNALEAVVGSIELRMQMGENPATIMNELDPKEHDSPHAHFVKAYLIAARLGTLKGEAHERAVAEARALIRQQWPALKNKPAVRALLGTIMHEDYLRTGDLADAETANSHYMVAEELVQNDPRYLAMVLGQLGLLHAEVGNYRIALDSLLKRRKLPFLDDVEALAVHLQTSYAQLHVGKDRDSADTADQALALVDRKAALAQYVTLTLDRAALANLSADRYERALALYDRELPLLEHAQGEHARRNRFVVRLAHAAAALGANQPVRALADLDALEPSLAHEGTLAAIAPPHSSPEQAGRAYGIIVSGLRANASRTLGKLDDARLALERRHTLFAERLKKSDLEEDARALTLVETRLAENAKARNDPASAARWLALALAQADALAKRSNLPVDRDQLHVLRAGAELHLLDGIPLDFDLRQRLLDAHVDASRDRLRSYREYERWFEIYLAMFEPVAARNPAAPTAK